MTPAARIAAAIGILDRIIAGEPAERVLTAWGRGNRYAGSGDRFALRDLVYDALRCRRSFGWLGGGGTLDGPPADASGAARGGIAETGETGRRLMIGALRASGTEPAFLFTGEGHAPGPLDLIETQARDLSDAPRAVALDCPDWLMQAFDGAFGPDADAVLRLLRHRAPLFLRVNLRKGTVAGAVAALAADGITAVAHPLSPTALEVTGGARRVALCRTYATGLVEVQDAASQAVADGLPVVPGSRVLDYCAGGGGKVLALAARVTAHYTAHDHDPGRMRDLPARAARAGAGIDIAPPGRLRGSFDLVLCDVPCSGSGAWRRSPAAKWLLTPDVLAGLVAEQAAILDRAAVLVAEDGTLAYATCSLFRAENEDQIADFLSRNRGWRLAATNRLSPLDGGDGFFTAHLMRV